MEGKLLSEGSYGLVYLIEDQKIVRKVFKNMNDINNYLNALYEVKALLFIREHDCSKYFVCIKGEYDLSDIKLHSKTITIQNEPEVKENLLYYYYDMEYIEGSTNLEKLIQTNNTNLDMKLALVYSILLAYNNLHKLCAHNDVKLSNLLFYFDENSDKIGVKIIDYGFACIINDNKCEKRLQDFDISYVSYYPPEYYDISLTHEYRKGDIWQIGLMIYAIVYQKNYPWRDTSREYLVNLTDSTISDLITQTRMRVSQEDMNQKSRQGLIQIDIVLKEIIRLCLVKEPHSRPKVSQLLSIFLSLDIIKNSLDIGADDLINYKTREKEKKNYYPYF